MPTTLSYVEIMAKLAADPAVSYVDDGDDEMYTNSEEPDWITVEEW